MNDIYIPKGGMCAVCTHKFEDCSGLHFMHMPVLERRSDKSRMASPSNEELVIVRCTMFQQGSPNLPDLVMSVPRI